MSCKKAVILSISTLTLVLGGARSGKSRFAEGLIEATPLEPVYVATAEPLDAEMAARIADHRQRRGDRWRLVEAPLALAEAIASQAQPGRAILVDCLTLWLANLLLAGRDPVGEGGRLLAVLGQVSGPVIIVSNEVGQGIVPLDPLSRRFVDEAGRLHQRLAAAADRVVLTVAGLPLELKPLERSCIS
jgi:adenosylcobinamide kinase/adenosylcobinamide-phosphate guanylyltransferase